MIKGRKYRNEKTKVDGITFDSKAESIRYEQLKREEILGWIQGLELQKKYILCKGRWKSTGKPYSISYKADFAYLRDGEIVLEDVKGFRTKEYQMKKKMLMSLYGIEITEIDAKELLKK